MTIQKERSVGEEGPWTLALIPHFGELTIANSPKGKLARCRDEVEERSRSHGSEEIDSMDSPTKLIGPALVFMLYSGLGLHFRYLSGHEEDGKRSYVDY